MMITKGKILIKVELELQPLAHKSISVSSAFFMQSITVPSSCFTSSISGGALHPRFIHTNSCFPIVLSLCAQWKSKIKRKFFAMFSKFKYKGLQKWQNS